MNQEKKLIELRSLVEAAEISLQQARKILVSFVGTEEEKMLTNEAYKKGQTASNEEGQIIEGIFDGQNMLGPDGKKYSVPANYASKSKLVEGDGLKLTITPDGSFVYKQINLLERERLVGELGVDDETSEYRVLAKNKAYCVLNASVTYFKGKPGDKVVILIPKDRQSGWAAVENIFKQGSREAEEAEASQAREEEASQAAAGEVASADEPDEAGADVKQAGDEFLEQENKQALKEENQPEDNKIEDIFEATEKTDVDDVRQVETEKAEKEEAVPPTAAGDGEDEIEIHKDNQGLEEI